MMSSKIAGRAFSALSGTEREVLSLLTAEKGTKEEFLGFLARYDIDNQASETTFLLNELLDRYRLQASDDPIIPRVRGLADFYRFQNATALMRQPANEAVVDADLYLKLRFPDDIRPFSALQPFLSREELKSIAGGRYAALLLKNTVSVDLHNNGYRIPEDRFMPDMIFLALYRSLRAGGNKRSTVCYLYDLYRYCPDKKPGLLLRFSILKKQLRRKAGGIKRWLLTRKH